jgi:hypothetical protein
MRYWYINHLKNKLRKEDNHAVLTNINVNRNFRHLDISILPSWYLVKKLRYLKTSQ